MKKNITQNLFFFSCISKCVAFVIIFLSFFVYNNSTHYVINAQGVIDPFPDIPNNGDPTPTSIPSDDSGKNDDASQTDDDRANDTKNAGVKADSNETGGGKLPNTSIKPVFAIAISTVLIVVAINFYLVSEYYNRTKVIKLVKKRIR